MTPSDWIAWTAAITRPRRADDELAPKGVSLPAWRDLYGVPGLAPGLPLPEVLAGQHLGPIPGEWCEVDGVCNGACRSLTPPAPGPSPQLP